MNYGCAPVWRGRSCSRDPRGSLQDMMEKETEGATDKGEAPQRRVGNEA